MQILVAKVLNRILKSQRRTCPVCGKHSYAFLPLPTQYSNYWKKYGFPYSAEDFETLNASEFSCPECGSTDRDRLFCLYLSQFQNHGSILDIAPSASLSKWIRSFISGKYVTADLYMTGVDLKLDIEDMRAIQSNEFDMIICSHVLEHVKDDTKALRELFRVLKPSGSAILMVPIVPKLAKIEEDPHESNIEKRWHRFGQDDHIRLYSKDGWISRLREVGFEIRELRVQDLTENPAVYGINLNSILYIANKP